MTSHRTAADIRNAIDGAVRTDNFIILKRAIVEDAYRLLSASPTPLQAVRRDEVIEELISACSELLKTCSYVPTKECVLGSPGSGNKIRDAMDKLLALKSPPPSNFMEAVERRKALEIDFYTGRFANYKWAREKIVWLLHELELMQERVSPPTSTDIEVSRDVVTQAIGYVLEDHGGFGWKDRIQEKLKNLLKSISPASPEESELDPDDAEFGMSEHRVPIAPGDVELREEVAKAIYDQWSDKVGFQPWVPRGNSFKQDEARRIADEALRSSRPSPAPEDETKLLEAADVKRLASIIMGVDGWAVYGGVTNTTIAFRIAEAIVTSERLPNEQERG